MTSWRDGVAEEVQEDMDGLLNLGLRSAREELEAGRPLTPIAVVVTMDESVETRSAAIAGATPIERRLALIVGLREEREDLRCAALIADATLPDGRDAVQVHIEHRLKAPALVAALPYKASENTIAYADLRAAVGDRQIWTEI